MKRLQTMEPGTVTGWDVPGASWAQRAAVSTEILAPLPDAVSFAQAATLPIAGMTALLALQTGGTPIGQRVLVTGANGGVGRFAIQLAALAQAHVTALVRDPAHAEALRALGAHEVVTQLDSDFDTIVEGVGGDTLGQAIRHVAPEGAIVSFASTEAETTFPTRDFFGRSPGATLHGLLVFPEMRCSANRGTRLLTTLAGLVAEGKLDCSIEREASWREAGQHVQALLDRAVAGKVVLHVD